MHEISDNVQERAENVRPRLGSAVGIGVGVILEALSPSGVPSMTADHHCRIGVISIEINLADHGFDIN